jgi:hypothetical protein
MNKKIYHKFLIAFLLIILANTNILAKTLPLKDYIQALTTKDAEYLNLMAESKKLKGEILRAESIYDISLAGQISKSKLDKVAQGSFIINDTNQLSSEISLNKRLKTTGTSTTLGYGYEATDMTVQMATTSKIENYNPYLYLSISQPLFQDFLGKLTKYPSQSLALLDKVIKLQEAEAIEEYFHRTISLYYDWALSTKALQVSLSHYKNTETLYKQISDKYKNDLVHKTDLLRSEENLKKAEISLDQQLNNYNQLLETICKKIEIEANCPTQASELTIQPSEYNIKPTFNTPQTNRIKHIFSLRKETLELDSEYIKEQSKLKFDAFATYKVYQYASSKTELTGKLNNTDYTIGVKSSLNLENKNTNGQKIVNQEKIKELELEKQKIIRDIAIKKTHTEKSIIQNQKAEKHYIQIIALSQERLTLESKRYNSGKIPLDNVIIAQNEHLNNQNSSLFHQIAKYKLFLQKLSLNDQLLTFVSNITNSVTKTITQNQED